MIIFRVTSLSRVGEVKKGGTRPLLELLAAEERSAEREGKTT